MNKSVIYILVILCSSTLARVAVDKETPDITNNEIHDEIKTKTNDEIHIDLPTYSKPVTDATTVKVSDTGPTEANNDVTTAKPENCSNLRQEITDNTISSDENVPCKPPISVDNGTALILTPYIKENRLSEARNACRVNSDVFLGVESYSGFLTVNETYDSNLFFWYFPNGGRPVNETPWVIWLQGGPGASSMTGLFDEIGPFNVDVEGSLKRNPYTWLEEHSLLFIDNPVGTGYSFTNHVDGFTEDMDTYGSHLYAALQQFLQIFPELRTAPLYVAGESYAGKYVPALAMQIHRHKGEIGAETNLQGLIVGNAYVEPAMITQMTRPFYYFGMLGREQIDMLQPLLTAFQKDVAANNSVKAKDRWNHLIAITLIMSHQSHAYNFLRDDIPVGRYLHVLRRADVKRALHVGDIRFSFVNMTVNQRLDKDFLSSARPLYEELLEHYRVLAYCGQLDQMLSCVLTSENYRTWQWSGAKDFLDAPRFPYKFNRKLAGYQKSGGRLTEVVVRGAGHMAALDAPAPLQRLAARWTRAPPAPLSPASAAALAPPAPPLFAPFFDDRFVREYVANHSMYL